MAAELPWEALIIKLLQQLFISSANKRKIDSAAVYRQEIFPHRCANILIQALAYAADFVIKWRTVSPNEAPSLHKKKQN